MRSTDNAGAKHRPVAFLWENFGPMHVDRCDAVVDRFGQSVAVHGIEIYSRSTTYAWIPGDGQRFVKQTLFQDAHAPGTMRLLRALIGASRRIGRGDYFLCHYEQVEVMLFAWWLRLTGSRVFAMGCAKFDDRPRFGWREMLKGAYMLPYQGAISSGLRSRDYFRFLGVPEKRIVGEYNTLSIDRVRAAAGVAPAPEGVAHGDRHFTVVARFVEKKNLHRTIRAYAAHRALATSPRRLVLCGSGPEEASLRALVAELNIADHVEFAGFLQSDGVARVLGSTLALLLLSVEEQFGNVVIEAQAMGVPVILSDACGARDKLVRSGVNGFVVEPDNIDGAARLMAMVADREPLWRGLAQEARKSAPEGDVVAFANGVQALAR